MHELPQLNREQLNKWKEGILGQNSTKFPDSFLFEQLFYERSALCKLESLAERIEALLKKYPPASTFESLKIMIPKVLEYLKYNDYFNEEEYEKELKTCRNMISGEKRVQIG